MGMQVPYRVCAKIQKKRNIWQPKKRNSFVGYLKGKSTLIIFERHANLKYKYGNRVFWCRGYYVSTVGNNKTAVARYVANQLKEDMMTDQITIKEYKDPFNGS